jgi:hypothetical protein
LTANGGFLTKLPNADKAIIEARKLRGYILSPTHPIGRFKAAFFQRLGYSTANWEALEQHLRELVLTEEVAEIEDMRYGKKFVIEGLLKCPSGETVKVVTVWVILKDEDIPRFVTVYPGG